MLSLSHYSFIISLSFIHLHFPISNFLYFPCDLCGWTGAAGHADSLSLLFCLRENSHPPSFKPMNTAWRMYVCVSVFACVCVLTGLWQCGVRRERGFISSARNSWMHLHSHTPFVSLEWLKHDESFTTSTLRGRAFGEQNFTPDDVSLQQRERGLQVCVVFIHNKYTQAQENRLWPLYTNNRMTSMQVVLCIAINSPWISVVNKTGIINSIINTSTA